MEVFKKKPVGSLINCNDIVYVRFNMKDRLCTIGPDKIIQDADGDTMLPRMVVLASQMFHGNIRNNRADDGTSVAKLEDYLFLFWVCPPNKDLVSAQLPQMVLCATPVVTRGQQNFKNYKTELVGTGVNPSEVITSLRFSTYTTKKEPKAGTVEFVRKDATKEEKAFIDKLPDWLESEEGARSLAGAVGEILNNYNVIMLDDNFAFANKQRRQFKLDFYGAPGLEAEANLIEDSGAELLSLPEGLTEIQLID